MKNGGSVKPEIEIARAIFAYCIGMCAVNNITARRSVGAMASKAEDRGFGSRTIQSVTKPIIATTNPDSRQ